jgi:hypothetical protein
MYDKYLTGSTFNPDGSRLPKHKGVIFNIAVAGQGFTAYFMNSSGNTMTAAFYLPAGPTVFSQQFYGISSLAAGVTGFLLS